MMLNFQKSYDAYIAREIFILSALPLAIFTYMAVGKNVGGLVKLNTKKRRKRQRSRTCGVAQSTDQLTRYRFFEIVFALV